MNRKFMPIAALALAAGLAGAVQAQGFQGRRGGDGLSLLQLPAPLQEKLQLTSDQKAKLEAMRAASREKMQAAFQEAQQAADRQAAQQKIQELRRSLDAEAEAVLSDEQKPKYTAWKTEAAAYPGIGRSAVALLMVDGITADQKSKLKSLSQERQAAQRELFQSLQGVDGPARREKMQAAQAETEAGVKKVLDANQQAQYDAALKAIPAPGRRPQQN